MTSPVSVREFSLEDINAVIELLQDVSVYRPSANEVPKLAVAFSSLSNCYACVAIQEHQLLGFGSVFFLNRVRGGQSAIIEDVVVAANVRGQGIGRQLIGTLLEVSRVRGCFKVSLEAAESAVPFYELLGFESAGKVMKNNLSNAMLIDQTRMYPR
jgi:glucosamine-phosphate N-acetyltransferase